jgi:hypothetical protein
MNILLGKCDLRHLPVPGHFALGEFFLQFPWIEATVDFAHGRSLFQRALADRIHSMTASAPFLQDCLASHRRSAELGGVQGCRQRKKQSNALIDIENLSDEILSRSEAAMRASIGKLKAGTYRGESHFDVPGGEIITLKSAVTVDPDAGEVTVDSGTCLSVSLIRMVEKDAREFLGLYRCLCQPRSRRSCYRPQGLLQQPVHGEKKTAWPQCRCALD